MFGDGCLHYGHKTSDIKRYFVRLIGKKRVYAEVFDEVTYPPFMEGDAHAVVLSVSDLKDFPQNCHDTDYLGGFLDGWVNMDGSKKNSDGYRLSTVNPRAEDWLRSHAAAAGWTLTGHSIEIQTHPIVIRGRETRRRGPQNCFNLTQSDRGWKVMRIVQLDNEQEVFGVVVAGMQPFALACGVLAGSCTPA